MERLTAKTLANMSDSQFAELSDTLERQIKRNPSIMTPPRRPRGEKPATTIRILRQQLAAAQRTVALLQAERTDKEQAIAGFHVRLAEAQDEIAGINDRWRFEVTQLTQELIAARAGQDRLAFLEGYYARSQEILAHDPAQTHRGAGQGNTEDLQTGRQTTQTKWPETRPAGLGAGIGDQIRGYASNDYARSHGRPVEKLEIDWEAAKDATKSQLKIHRG